ncbi:MAG: uridine kinase [Candidatus Latescibacteria bacterium]|nr:uridine kinase [Candidatus Latescibacterota bacterium]
MASDPHRRNILIGLAGGTGAGKTLVAQSIAQDLGSDSVLLIEQDSYYKDLQHIPLGERENRNFDHPDAFDRDLLRTQLEALLAGREVDMPSYDMRTHTRLGEPRRVRGRRIMILDGLLVLEDPALRHLMDIKIYVDADPDIRFIRRLKRDLTERGRTLDQVIRQYESTVRPMHLQFVEPSKRYADLVIPEGGYNFVAIDLLKTKVRSLLADSR